MAHWKTGKEFGIPFKKGIIPEFIHERGRFYLEIVKICKKKIMKSLL